MSDNLTCLQAYKIMYDFFHIIYFETYDESLSDILSAGSLYSENSNESPQTMDPAVWNDWICAVRSVFDDNAITHDSIKLTNKQAYTVMSQYLITYCNIGAPDSIKVLRDLINIKTEKSCCVEWLHYKWEKSIQKILNQNSLSEQVTHFFGKQTKLTNREAFVTMQFFLDLLCQKNHNKDLIQLIQNSRIKNKDNYWTSIPNIIKPEIFKIWQQAIDDSLLHDQNKQLNLLIIYKVILLFLMKFFHNNQSDFINKMIKNFEIKDESKPQYSLYWISWLSAAVSVNAQQIEKNNNLISIKTSISEVVAFKIIKTWVQEYRDLLSLDFIEKMNLEQSDVIVVWQYIINRITKRRSSYLLMEGEVIILEVYESMTELLKFYKEHVSKFDIDSNGKPINFYIMLQWIRICEQVIHEKVNRAAGF